MSAADPELAELAGWLGVTMRDLGLLGRALVHRSWSFEHHVASNERLEFLGDAVLEVVVTDELLHLCPEAAEGRLAEMRSATVSERSLAAIARENDLGHHLRLGVGEAASGGADKDSLLADALEAVLGAIYLDGGFAMAYRATHRLFAGRLADLVSRTTVVDPKTTMQEHAEATTGQPPVYATTASGPDHRPVFDATVELAGEVVGHGRGGSRKTAQRAAAAEALAALVGPVDPHVIPPPTVLAGTMGLGATIDPAGDGTGTLGSANRPA